MLKNFQPFLKSNSRLYQAQTTVYFLSFVALGLFTSVLGPTLPGLADHTRSRPAEISILFTARSFGYLLGSLTSGRAFDRYPGHILLSGVLLLAACTAALAPVVSVLWALALVLLLLGIAEGGLDVGGNLMLVWVHRDRSAPFLNALHFCFGLGAFLMPLIVAQTILISGDISGAYWIMAIIPLPLAIWLWRIPSPSTPKSTTDSDGEATNAWLVAGISTILFLYVGAEVSFGGWIYSYAVTLGLENQVSAAYLTSVFWGALTIGRLLAVPIATRIRPRALLLMDLLGCIACLICMIALWQSNRVLWIGTIALGLSMASFFPTTLAYAARHLAVRGSVTRWFFVGSGVGGMLLPWLIGQLIESHSAQVVLVAILADLVLALIIFVISNRYPSVEVEMENQWEQAAD